MAIVSYMFLGILVKCPLFLSDLNQTWIFSANFQKILQHQIFLKIRPVEAMLFHMDRRLDKHDKANSHFPQFCEYA
jgi:hypothetical protein